MSDRVIAVGYSLRAVCLVVHETTCMKCKAVYRVPQGTMLKLSKPDGTIYVSPKVASWDLDLPREKRTVSTTVDACEECFKEQSGKRDGSEYTLLDRRVGKGTELFLRPRKVEDIEVRLAGDNINRTTPQRHRGRPKADPVPDKPLSEMF